jgi:hypothetical protein
MWSTEAASCTPLSAASALSSVRTWARAAQVRLSCARLGLVVVAVVVAVAQQVFGLVVVVPMLTEGTWRRQEALPLRTAQRLLRSVARRADTRAQNKSHERKKTAGSC